VTLWVRIAACTPSSTARTTASTRSALTAAPPWLLARRNDSVALAPEPAAVGACFSVVVMVGLLADQRLRRNDTSSFPIRSGTVQPSRSYSLRHCSARPFMAAAVPCPSAAKSSSAFTFSWLPE
jgi:hypothetical protein